MAAPLCFDTPEISLIDLALSHLKFHQIQKHDLPSSFWKQPRVH